MVSRTVGRYASGPIGFLLLVTGLMGVTPASAHAYLDPISGSIILQVLAAGALAGILTVKRFWAGIKQMGNRLLGQRDES